MMNFYRIDFYNLLIELLNSIEDDKYFLLMARLNKVTASDVNNKKVTIYNKYVVLNKNKKLVFEDYVKVEEYYDFNYYRTDSTYYDSGIIGIEQIKNIILQNVINYPYLITLYNILLELGSKCGYEIVKLDNEKIISLVKEYAREEKKLSNKVLQRKKEKD